MPDRWVQVDAEKWLFAEADLHPPLLLCGLIRVAAVSERRPQSLTRGLFARWVASG